jgi:hypothetical protein
LEGIVATVSASDNFYAGITVAVLLLANLAYSVFNRKKRIFTSIQE